MFTLVTGVMYIILEIRQKDLMWLVGIVTSLAAMWVFFRQNLYASFGLNTYYLITAFIGLWQWGKDKQKLKASGKKKKASKASIHLNRLDWKTVILSALIVAAGTWGLALLMQHFENPMSYLDASVAVLSAVATWWLVRSYLEQWWLWIVADLMSTVLCASQGMWWMAALYLAYVLSAIYGLMYWKKNGRYLADI